MAKTVVWKPKANQQILDIETFLLEHFSQRAVDRFLDKLYHKLEFLEKFPESGQRTRFKTIRRWRINRIPACSIGFKAILSSFILFGTIGKTPIRILGFDNTSEDAVGVEDGEYYRSWLPS